MHRSAKRIAFLALITAGFCWGLGFPLSKLVLRETDAAHLVLLRFAVAALVAAPFASAHGSIGVRRVTSKVASLW